MIETEEFEKIQILLGKSNRRRTPKEWTFTGDLVCDECGAAIINDEKWQIICSKCKTKFHKAEGRDHCIQCKTPISEMDKPKLLHYHWLRCGKTKKTNDGHKCHQKSVAIKKFEKEVDSLLKKIEIPKDFTDWAITVLNEQSEREIDDRQMVQANLRDGLKEVETKLDNMLMLKISPQNKNGEVITQGEYIKQRQDLLIEKQAYERQLTKQSKRQDDWLELSEKTFNFACYARYWFTNGTKEQKRTILRTLGLNLRLRDQRILIDPYEPFQIIADMKENFGKYLPLFEPLKLGNKSIKNGDLKTAIPHLLRGKDSNLDRQLQRLLSCR
jgi:hypothetical protein